MGLLSHRMLCISLGSRVLFLNNPRNHGRRYDVPSSSSQSLITI